MTLALPDLPADLAWFDNGDLMVDPSGPSGGVGLGAMDEGGDKPKAGGKGKGKKNPNKRLNEGEEAKPVIKKPRALVMPAPGQAAPPVIDHFRLSDEQLAQLSVQFDTVSLERSAWPTSPCR